MLRQLTLRRPTMQDLPKNLKNTPILALVFSFLITPVTAHEIKDATFIVYMAADNDLVRFGDQNLRQLQAVGSTPYINILVQLDRPGSNETTKRFYVEKNNLVQVNAHDPSGAQKLDFGNAQTLIDCFKWVITEFPARHYYFDFWNHGTGVYDGFGGKAPNASELFMFNPTTYMLDINRSIEFFDHLLKKSDTSPYPRGICFNDTFGSYLTSAKLNYAFKTIMTLLPEGQKIDIIGFDACLMSMIEIGSLLKPYAHIMIGSEEVELATGWRYDKILEPFLERALTPIEFAKHIVDTYHASYQTITNDYTLSAINLDNLAEAENALNTIATILIDVLSHQQNNTATRLIRASRSKRFCTYFAEPTYIDLQHFLTNLLEAIDFMSLSPEKTYLKQDLATALVSCINALKQTTIANKTGKNLMGAQGLSIYFPYKSIEQSYYCTPFANTNSWVAFLKVFLLL